ncbi:Hpt domain-containing protein [Flavobacterium silvisoli]|uniref:Hpt domain-containing protein n=1 Tax=Flavobacterium silvisoli TaxID=2529433 RepID=A0A4Q9YTS7_9FLAO|nr:Hpt domain-containing protein [Flavobacterium silvisoli]TBX67033.1 Hpt domain-containing protein [Flavobacterium silvisoli]
MEEPNIEYILKLSRNEEAIKQRFINILKFELPIEIDAYYMSLRLNKWPQTMTCIHKLKNKIAILGLENSYHLADEYEKSNPNSRKDLQIEFEKTLTLMQHFVNCL